MRKYLVPAALILIVSGSAAMAQSEMTVEKNTVVPGVGSSSSSTTITQPAPVVVTPAPAAVQETKVKRKWYDWRGHKHTTKAKTESIEAQ